MRSVSKHHLNGNHSPFGYSREEDMTDEAKAAMKQRDERIIAKRLRKQAFLDRMAMQGKMSKALLIVTPKGKNGRTMNAALLAKHGIKKGDQPS